MPTNDDLSTRLSVQREAMKLQIKASLERLHDQNERQRLAISPSHQRILEYFWNSKRKEDRPIIPISVVYFLETSDSPEPHRVMNESTVNVLVAELIAKGYISREKRKPEQYSFLDREEDVLVLTRQGIKYILRKHPQALVWWTKLLESTPGYISLSITAVGLLASIFGIIEFISR